jgi:hypothetical protein
MKISAGTKKSLNRISWVIILSYIVTYMVLSLNGQYSEELVVTGRLQNEYQMGMPDAHVWEPKFMKLRHYQHNLLGGCYLHLIWTDRKFWHTNVMLYPIYYPPGTYIDTEAVKKGAGRASGASVTH